MTLIYTARGIIKQSVDYVGMAATRNICNAPLLWDMGTWYESPTEFSNLYF